MQTSSKTVNGELSHRVNILYWSDGSEKRRISWLSLIGLVQRSAATWRCMLHSSDELGELSQWQCTATMTAP